MRDLSRQAAAGPRYRALMVKASEPSERVHALRGAGRVAEAELSDLWLTVQKNIRSIQVLIP